MGGRKIWVNITDDQGVLEERIEIQDYDLSRPIAQAVVCEDLRKAQERINKRYQEEATNA